MSDQGPLAQQMQPSARLDHPQRVLAGCWLAMAVAALPLFMRPISTFITAQWYYTYELGFVRRGLWGSTLEVLGDPSLGSIVSSATLFYLLAAGALVVAAVGVSTDDARIDPTRAVLTSALFGSASGFPFLVTHLGRFDAPTILLTVVALLLVERFATGGSVIVAAALLAVAVLGHEAALVTATPWAAVWVGTRIGSVRGRIPGLAATLVVLGLPVILFLALRPPAMSRADFATWLGARVGRPLTVLHFDVAVPFQTPDEGFRAAADLLQTPEGKVFLAVAILQVLPLLAACWMALSDSGLGWQQLDRRERKLYALALLPISLCAVALDFSRWWAFSGLLVTATTLHVLRTRGRHTPVSCAMWLLVALSLAAMVAGVIFERTIGH